MNRTMDEKIQVEEDQHHCQPSSSPILPSYEHIAQTPPPPSYLQSTRLHYKNQPFISDFEELTYRQEQERQRADNQSDTWSEIANLPLRQRMIYYLSSWSNTIYDGRLIFFAFFVFASLTTLAVVVSVVTIPSLLNH